MSNQEQQNQDQNSMLVDAEGQPPAQQTKKRTFDQLMSSNFVSTQTLLCFYRSKHDLYKYFTERRQALLPSYSATRIRFLRDLNAGVKQYLLLKDVKMIKVPHYPALAVKNLYPKVSPTRIDRSTLCQLKGDARISAHLPDYSEGEMPEAHFFFAVVGTLNYDWLMEQIEDQHLQRYRNYQTGEKKHVIKISAAEFEHLEESNFISQKNGRAIYMMQVGAKGKRAYRKPKEYPLKEARKQQDKET